MEVEGCECEGFYKIEYFLALDTIQKLREELSDNEKSWQETCDIISNAETMEDIKKSMQQVMDGKTIPLSELYSQTKEEVNNG